jgi:D-arabinose 1-dehydrogenase-like Zn-dependent alcohol dehydrogenase
MKVRCLQTQGQGFFEEVAYEVPPCGQDQIRVKNIMTGVCRSDIDMMQGNFGPLPLEMQGHEGLGQVIEVGEEITHVAIGDFVATRGEPAYADFYNVRKNEFVQVPEAHPRYIIEPVACAINLVQHDFEKIKNIARYGDVLIIGSGFLSWVAYNYLSLFAKDENIDVLGTNNQDIWGSKLLSKTEKSYDMVMDISGKYSLGIDIDLNNSATIIDAVGKSVSHDEAQKQLWKSCTTIRPSPRNLNFHQCMKDAIWMIEHKHIDVDKFWTRAYNRNTEWQQAFADGADRTNGYSRGYIKWH